MALPSVLSQTYAHHYVKTEEWVNTGTQDVMVFHPTLEEISDFPALIRKIEQAGAHLKSGICKIVPPEGWSPRPSKAPGDYSDIDDFRIYSPVKETIEGMNGCFTRSIKVHRKKMTVADFRRIALLPEMAISKPDLSLTELENHYWKNILFGEPIYGADSPGTLFDENVREFNMTNLGTILDLLDELQIKISGVNTPFLYFGMWKTTFPWHVEDMDLYSINYLHYGEPKFWYAIPSDAAQRFERLACQQFPDGANICRAFLRHKLYIISPNQLRKNSIPYGTMVQYPNEIVITFPKGYHMGFNVGYNCAEAINFALERWIDFGKDALLCYCRQDGVEIDMQPFMQKYRPDEFQAWYDYWYGERHANKEEKEKSRRKAAQQQLDPVLDVICADRNKRLAHAKRSVCNLWSTQPVNFFAEKEYNVRRSKLFPHCAVCQYFIQRRTLIVQKSRSNLPKASRRYVTDQQFYKDAEELLPVERRQLVNDDLYQCANCHVVVHKQCYSYFEGFDIFTNLVPNAPSKFLCVRCCGHDDTEIRASACALCELRGGALVELRGDDGMAPADLQPAFTHVVCAMLHANTRFADPNGRRVAVRRPAGAMTDSTKDGCQHGDSLSISFSQSSQLDESSFSTTNSTTSVDVFSTVSTSWQAEKNLMKNALSLSNHSNVNSTASTSAAEDPFYFSVTTPTTSRSISPRPTVYKKSSRSAALSRYQCEVCDGVSRDLIRCDICVSVEGGSAAASLRYHVTCAPLADMAFERRDVAPYAVAICPFHNSDHVVMKADTREITEGERVIIAVDDEKIVDDEGKSGGSAHALIRAEPEGQLVGKGRITDASDCLFCTVDFLDGSVSADLFPCDIRRCECQAFGCKLTSHIPGSLVYVQWHDGKTYAGYYRGVGPTRKYHVLLDPEFQRRLPSSEPAVPRRGEQSTEPADILELNQTEVFTLDEPLPEDVRLALLKRRSIASLDYSRASSEPSPSRARLSSVESPRSPC